MKEWLRVYAHARSMPTYYKRGRKWALVYFVPGYRERGQVMVAFDQAELKRLQKLTEDKKHQWYEAHVIDIEDAIGFEIEDDYYEFSTGAGDPGNMK